MPLEDLLVPDYNFPRMKLLHQTDPDNNIDSSGERDIQQSNKANFMQDQMADNTLMDLWKTNNKEESLLVTNKGV